MSPSPPAAPDDISVKGGIAFKIGSATLLLFVFFLFSRLLDMVPNRLHLPLVLSLVTLVMAVLAGGFFESLRTRLALMLALMLIWMLMGVPFSVWRVGSLQLITGVWLRSALLCLLLVGLSVRIRHVQYAMNAIALASLVVALSGLTMRTVGEGRIEVSGTRFDNPNDMAFVLLLGMPLWVRYMASGKRNLAGRCMGGLALLVLVTSFVRTGSRGAMVGLVAMLAVFFLRASFAGKAKVLVASLVLVAVAYIVLPAYLRQRFFTFQTADSTTAATVGELRELKSAAASAQARRQHLIDSINMTLHHPVFGVGAGNFINAQAVLDREAGRRPAWLGTHNTYTQISSECGVPALIIFLALLVHSIRSARRASKLVANLNTPEAAEIRKAALAGEMCMWGMCAAILFAHMGFDPTVYVFLGLMSALQRATQVEIAAPEPAPATIPVRPFRVVKATGA